VDAKKKANGEDAKMDNTMAELTKVAQSEHTKMAVAEWMQVAVPDSICEIIEVLLGKGSQSDY
jgi:hypothetical protein